MFRERGGVIYVHCNTVFCSAVFYRCVIQMESAKDLKLKHIYPNLLNIRLYRVVYTHRHCGSPAEI